MLAEGDGAPADLIEAYKWLSLTASRYAGLNDAIATKSSESLKLLKKGMSSQQIAEGEQRADRWVPKTLKGLSQSTQAPH